MTASKGAISAAMVMKRFWTSTKATKFGTYPTLKEAEEAAEKLNNSPSGEWNDYFAAAIPAEGPRRTK